VGGVESTPAWYSPLGTVAMETDGLAALVAALPEQVRNRIMDESALRVVRGARACLADAERRLAELRASLGGGERLPR
jgi:hypothetical protein